MPIYRFSCSVCGHEKRELVPLGTETIQCEKCGSIMKRAFSAGVLVKYNAEGFYCVESRKRERKTESAKEAEKFIAI